MPILLSTSPRRMKKELVANPRTAKQNYHLRNNTKSKSKQDKYRLVLFIFLEILKGIVGGFHLKAKPIQYEMTLNEKQILCLHIKYLLSLASSILGLRTTQS